MAAPLSSIRPYSESESRADSANDELKRSLKQARLAMESLTAAVDRVERDRLRGRSDSLTDVTEIESSSLLRIVLQRTIVGETLDEDCEKLIAVLSKATGGQDLNSQPARKSNALPDEGYYKFEGNFVKVQVSESSGKPYAKCWMGEDEGWKYSPGLYFKMRDATPLTAEDAKAFGDLYGHCVFCGTKLTDERSITAGYGPTCATNRNLPWGYREESSK